MKRYFIVCLISALSAVFYWSCSSLMECDEIQQKEVIILMDVSDPDLFEGIENDLTQNFPGFMQRTGLGSIKPCQRFTLSFAHLSGKEALDLSSASISISNKGLSRMEEKKQASPVTLVALMRKKIAEYRLLSEDPEMTAESNIANVLFKAIVYADSDAENLILLFSDMVENNRWLNLYRKIPDEQDMSFLIEKMIEPSLLQKFITTREQGIDLEIIIVLKPEPAGKIDLRKIQGFWTRFFRELKLDGQVWFIDNLTNPIKL